MNAPRAAKRLAILVLGFTLSIGAIATQAPAYHDHRGLRWVEPESAEPLPHELGRLGGYREGSL